MFGIFKKKEATPAPDPVAAKASERMREQTEIAELQSQISELRRQSNQMNAELAKKAEERAGLMAKIKTVPQAQKTALALRVKNIDKAVAGISGNLALIEQQIGNNESIILQKGATVTVDVGNVENVVNAEKHRVKIQEAIEKKNAGDINVGIADEMLSELTGGGLAMADDIADILAEAEGSDPQSQQTGLAQSTSEAIRPQSAKSSRQV